MISLKFLSAPVQSFRSYKAEYSNQHKTQRNIEEQMAKMKKMIRSPISKRKQEGNSSPKTFGVSLEELLKRNTEESDIPKVVERITDFIKCHGIRHEGIFRVNGNVKVVERLKADFDRDGDANLEESGDIMSIAGLIKMFLRELPEPLIPQHFKTSYIQVHKDYHIDKNECHLRMRNLSDDLPKPNRQLLKFLCRFLVLISLNEDANKMHAKALAIVFAPNIFRCADGIEGIKEQSITNSIMGKFIEEYDIILKDENEDSPSLINCIQVQEAKDNNFVCPPVMPVPYKQHKRLKDSPDQCEMISPYAEFRVVENDRLLINEAAKPKNESHIYASVSKAQREAILSSTIYDHYPGEAEPYIRSNSPSWHKPTGEVSSPKLGSSPKSRKKYMEKTIRESINEHLFGHNLTSTSEESDKLDSPGEEVPPVPPRSANLIVYEESGVTKPQKRKKRRLSKTSQDNIKNVPSNEELKDNVDGPVDQGHPTEVRCKQDELDLTSGKPGKRIHRPKLHEMENNPRLIVNVVDVDSPNKPLTMDKSDFMNNQDEGYVEDVDLSTIERLSEVLSCLTLNRAPLPKKRRPPSLHKSIPTKLNFKITDLDVKTDLKSLPRKPPSPPPRPTLSPSNSISPSVASKLERRKQVRSMPEHAKVLADRDVEIDNESTSSASDDSPTTQQKKNRRIPPIIIPPLELYKLAERTEDDPMVSPRERYEGSSFDDAMVSPRSRRATLDIRGFSTECPPSPPAMQENHFWLDKKQNTSPKGESTIKELTKRMQSLKKKIKEFEEKFEDENGYKPSQSQDRHPIKKYVSELGRTRKLIQELKEKRNQGDRSSGETSPQGSTKELLLTTLPKTVEQSLKDSLNKLKAKRESSGRPEIIDDMSRDQIQDEKLAFQKVLLQHESTFGRPTSKRDKDVMKPLYDRYRMIKRKLLSFNAQHSEATSSSTLSTNEREARRQSPERPSELQLTLVDQDLPLGSPSHDDSRLTQSLPARNMKGKARKLFDNDVSPVSPLTICVDEPLEDITLNSEDADYSADLDDKDGEDNTEAATKHSLLTAKDSDAILHQASMQELLEQQASASRRKKKLRKKLKTFEDNFAKTTGRKVQKEDRGDHEGDYEEYKKIKARLRLLDALITKQQGNNTI